MQTSTPRSASRKPLRQGGFTLIELLIVIAIIGILIAAIAVAVTKAKEFANNNDQKSNMKQLVTACRVMEVENGRLPPAWDQDYGRKPTNPAGLPTNLFRPGVFVWMLPYVEQKGIFDDNWVGNQPYSIHQSVVRVYQSLMDPTISDPKQVTSFGANIRVFSTWGAIQPYNGAVDLSSGNPMPGGNDWFNFLSTEKITDGAGNTIFFTTRYGRCAATAHRYYAPPHNQSDRGPFFGAGKYQNVPAPKVVSGVSTYPPYQIAPTLALTSTDGSHCNDDRGVLPHSFGGAGLAVALGDTSVRNLSFTISGETFARAICPFDNQPLGTDW